MMTDDLLGRLEPESLIEQPDTSSPFYVHDVVDTTKEIQKVLVLLSFISVGREAEPLMVDAELVSLSFGDEGWRCAVDAVEPALMLELTKRTTATAIVQVDVLYMESQVSSGPVPLAKLTGNVDVTAHFGGLDGKCSVTVAADNGASI